MIRADVPAYARLQEELTRGERVAAPARVLELGTGTGETARRLLTRTRRRCWSASTRALRCSAVARVGAAGERVDLRVGAIEEPLPEGPFDLVASALCVHHLDGPEKADLFARRAVCASARRAVRAGRRRRAGRSGGRDDPADARI